MNTLALRSVVLRDLLRDLRHTEARAASDLADKSSHPEPD